MAYVNVDGYEFSVPDDKVITGEDIKKMAEKEIGRPISGGPIINRENQLIALRSDEAIIPKKNDLITFIELFETAWGK